MAAGCVCHGEVEVTMRRPRANITVDRIVVTLMAAQLVVNGSFGGDGGAQAQTRELATVRRAELLVYATTDRDGRVKRALLRGDLVEIDGVIPTAEGEWCSVTEVVGPRVSGYVPCDGLERHPTRPLEALGLIPKQEPVPKPKVTVEERGVTAEGRYAVQVAALVLERNAHSLRQRLEGLGYAPVIRMGNAAVMRHRVSAGEFASRLDAEAVARRLRAEGFSATVIDLPDGKIRVEIGSPFHLDDAIDLAGSLEKKNYPSKIVSEKIHTPVYQVRIGAYPRRAEAAKVLEALKRQGFAPIIVRE
jgi:cell division septation protein DedD